VPKAGELVVVELGVVLIRMTLFSSSGEGVPTAG